MKYTKKLLSLVLVLVLALALAVPGFADEATSGTNDPTTGVKGTITIQNPVEDATYTIYRLLDLESYNSQSGAYAYKVNTAWADFFAQGSIKDVYVSIDAQGYVTWVERADVQAFAQLALAYAKEHQIPNNGTGETTYTDLALGYYLIDSSVGSLCALDTTNNEVIVYEKNGEPTLVKKVHEDSSNTYESANTADIYETLTFQATITVPGGKNTSTEDDSSIDTNKPGAQNYVLHDTMDPQLVFGSVTGVTLNGTPVTNDSNANYTVKTSDIGSEDFQVVFTKAFCDTLKKDDVIVVTYTATFADTGVVANTAYKNTATLSYGDTHTTVESSTTSKTFKMDVYKYTMVEDNKQGLGEAEFVLYKGSIEDGTVQYAIASEAVNDVYTITGWTEKGSETGRTTFKSPADGEFTIFGLDADIYYLKETVAPDGYNVLANDVKVEIAADGTMKQDGKGTTTIEVLNQTGTELPSTGGMGTTIFYTLGGVLVVGAAILLVTKKRVHDVEG